MRTIGYDPEDYMLVRVGDLQKGDLITLNYDYNDQLFEVVEVLPYNHKGPFWPGAMGQVYLDSMDEVRPRELITMKLDHEILISID